MTYLTCLNYLKIAYVEGCDQVTELLHLIRCVTRIYV